MNTSVYADFTYENIGLGLVEFTAVSLTAQEAVGALDGGPASQIVDFDTADVLALMLELEGFILEPVAGDASIAA